MTPPEQGSDGGPSRMHFESSAGQVTIESTWETDPLLLRHRYRGMPSGDEVVALSDHVYTDPRLVSGGAVIHELFDVDFTMLDTAAMTRIAAHRMEPPPPADLRVAVVASGDVGFGLSRMLEQLAEDGRPLRVGVFRTVDAARDWIRSLA